MTTVTLKPPTKSEQTYRIGDWARYDAMKHGK